MANLAGQVLFCYRSLLQLTSKSFSIYSTHLYCELPDAAAVVTSAYKIFKIASYSSRLTHSHRSNQTQNLTANSPHPILAEASVSLAVEGRKAEFSPLAAQETASLRKFSNEMGFTFHWILS